MMEESTGSLQTQRSECDETCQWIMIIQADESALVGCGRVPRLLRRVTRLLRWVLRWVGILWWVARLLRRVPRLLWRVASLRRVPRLLRRVRLRSCGKQGGGHEVGIACRRDH